MSALRDDTDEVLAEMARLIPQIEPMMQASAEVMARGVLSFINALMKESAEDWLTHADVIDLSCAWLGGMRAIGQKR